MIGGRPISRLPYAMRPLISDVLRDQISGVREKPKADNLPRAVAANEPLRILLIHPTGMDPIPGLVVDQALEFVVDPIWPGYP